MSIIPGVAMRVVETRARGRVLQSRDSHEIHNTLFATISLSCDVFIGHVILIYFCKIM